MLAESLPISDYRCYHIDFLCSVGEAKCRYWIDDFDIGNCVLRCDREHGLKEVASRLGISYQAIQHIEIRAYKKIKERLKRDWRNGRVEI